MTGCLDDSLETKFYTIKATSQEFLGPQMVVKSKEIPGLFQGNLGEGDIKNSFGQITCVCLALRIQEYPQKEISPKNPNGIGFLDHQSVGG